jgi:arylsulfatase
MIEHDATIGQILKKPDDLGIANDTILICTTDNGPHQNSWPDAGTALFRSEKNTNWEGAFRVPAMIRWPSRIKPGSVAIDIVSGLDWFPTLLAAAQDVVGKFLATFKEYPPSQSPDSFGIDQIVDKMRRQMEAAQSK